MVGRLDEEIVIKEFTYGDVDDYDEVEEEETDEQSRKYKSVNSNILNRCTIIKDGFGLHRDEKSNGDCRVIHRFTLVNKNNISVQVITYGATIVSIKTPDRNGHFDDIVMGFENVQGYRDLRNPYFGATIGRVTGVIPKYVFSVAKNEYFVSKNFLDSHHVNGGFIGFDKVVWDANISDGKLCLSYMSRDLEEGFPGDVVINRSFDLTPDDELIIETSGHCSRPTPLDVSTHVDWNLSSHVSGSKELYKHFLQVNADKYARLDKDRMLTGELRRVSGTIFDLRIPRPLGRIIHRVPGGGYDHYMRLIRGPDKNGITFAAKLIHPDSGRFVDLMSDQPGIFVYTQNNLFAENYIVEAHPISCWCHNAFLIMEQKRIKNPGDLSGSLKLDRYCEPKADPYGPIYGKYGAVYQRHGGIRLVPANYPEPVSRHYKLNTFLLRPGQTYKNTTVYKFGNTFDEKYDPLGECNWKNILF